MSEKQVFMNMTWHLLNCKWHNQCQLSGLQPDFFYFIFFTNNPTHSPSLWVKGCLLNQDVSPQYDTSAASPPSLSLSVFLSLHCPLQLVPASAQQLAHTSMCLGVSLHACQFAWASSVLTVWCTVSGRQERPWGNTLLPYQRLILAKWPPKDNATMFRC